jgi:hypothetical protein
MPLLLDHFRIRRDDPDRWHKLSLCLAIAHVLGFQERHKGGRPRTLSQEEEGRLYSRFYELQANGHSDRNAARLIAKDLQKAGRSGISDAAILRRMQRIQKNAKERTELLEKLTGAQG